MKPLLLLCLFTNIGCCLSQKSKPALFDSSFGYDLIDHGDHRGESQTISSHLNFPLYRKGSQFFAGRLQFKSRIINGLGPEIDNRLYATDLHLFWQRTITTKYKVNLFSQAGIHSDFLDISSDDWRYSLGFRLAVKHSGRFKSGWGIVYSRQHFGHQLNPFISIEYQLNARWSISGLLPIKPKITYKINSCWSWITELSGSVGSYRLSEVTENNNYLRVNNWHLINRLEYTVKKHHRFNLSVGYNLRQHFRRYAANDAQNWSILTIDLGSNNAPLVEIKARGWMFKAGYSFVLSQEKE